MTDSAQTPSAKSFDLVWFGASAFFALAAAAAAYPVIKAGPVTAGGMLLIAGLVIVTFLGIFAFGAQNKREPDGLERLPDVLSEPAAVISLDGKLRCANEAWRSHVGLATRLEGGRAALYSALSAARRGDSTSVALKTLGGEDVAEVAALGQKRLLVRFLPRSVAAPAASPVAEPAATPARISREPATQLAPFGAAVLDGDDPMSALIREANAALHAMAGDAAAPGLPFRDLLDETSRKDAAERIAAGQAGPFEVRLAHDQAKIAHLYLTRGEGGVIAYLVDVSEQKQIELQLMQSQKMQAIGQLAGGVAHDFNNLLTGIELRLDALLQRHPVGDPSYELLIQIRQHGVRAADLVRKLLAFSRKQTVQRVTLDIGELISESQVLLGRLLPEDMKLDTHYGRDLPKVRLDKGQLETAIMNLVVNARDAIKSHRPGPGGVITVKTARLTHAQAVALGYADPKATGGDLALIEVSDNGPGIADDVIGKIFEPFFTTKEVGEGTGFGLATVYGIVEQASGWIEASNGEAGGAVFRVFLPVYIPAEGEVEEPVKPVRQQPRDLSGVGRILFVEDDDSVRGIAARLLRGCGYTVSEACDGEEALELAEEHAGEIDLMISDVIMPGMDGPTLLKKAKGYLGAAPVMFISGYAESDFSDLLEGEKNVTFLAKPLNIKILAGQVKQRLQEAA